MSFTAKITEFKNSAINSQTTNCYNMGASRAYYSAYLHAREYLKAKKFAYKQFVSSLKDIKNPSDYAHETIFRALVDCLEKNGKPSDEIDKLAGWDNLYRKRIKADYYKEMIDQNEIRECVQILNEILNVIK